MTAPVAVERLEARALLAVTAQVVGGELAIRFKAAKDLATLTAHETHYAVTGTGMEAKTFAKSAVTRITVADSGVSLAGQVLLVGGTSAITRPLAVTNIEATTLATDIAIAGATGDVSFGGPVLLPTGRSLKIGNEGGAVLFKSTLNGAGRLTIDAPGQVVGFSGEVGNTTPLVSLAFPRAGTVLASQAIAIDGRRSGVSGGIVLGSGVGQVQMQAKGSSVKGCQSGILIESAPLIPENASRRLANFKITNNGTGILFAYAPGMASTDGIAGFHGWAIQDNTVSDNALHGIHMSADKNGMLRSREVLIPRNIISRNKLDGIRIDGWVEKMQVYQNTLLSNGSSADDAAIRMTDGHGLSNGLYRDVTISGNLISGFAPTVKFRAIPVSGVVAHDMPALWIRNNQIMNVGSGISLSGTFTFPATNIPVVDTNTILKASRSGVVLDATRDVIMSLGECRDGAGVGFKASGDCAGTVVKGTIFARNAAGGILLDAARGMRFEKVAVAGNKSQGVRAAGVCSGSVMTESTVSGNATGVLLDAAAGITLQDSTIEQSGGNGLQATGICASTVSNVRISGSKQNGVVLSAARHLKILNSTSNGNAVHGLVATGDCAATSVQGSAFKLNGQVGVVLNGAAGIALATTEVSGNAAHGLWAIGACTGASLTGVTLAGNKQAGGVFSAAQGLTVDGGSKFTGNGGNGVYADGNCAGTKLSGSTVSANGNAGLSLVGAKGLTITASVIGGNKNFGLYAIGDAAGTTVTGNVISGSKTNIFVTAVGGSFQKA